MANLPNMYRAHVACDQKIRNDPIACAACFARRFGDPLAERRCWYCGTDAFHRPEWRGWREAGGHLACGQCAHRVEQGEQRFVRSVSTYRALPEYAPGVRAFDTYCSLKHLKDNRAVLDPILLTPLGNVLAESVRRLVREEQLGDGVLLVPAPGSTPARQHARALTVQAAQSLGGLAVGLDVLQNPGTGESKGRDLAGRAARAVPTVNGDVRGRVIVVTDDLYTTGQTLLHCADALLGADAARVYGATVARVVYPPTPEDVFDSSEFLGGTFTEVVWTELRDAGVFAVAKDTTSVRLRFGCSGCAEILTTEPVLVGANGQALHLTCETCGAAHDLSVTWKGPRYLSATLKGRRTSEIIVAQDGT